MTDAAGLVLGLPGTFISCIQCVEYIQLGRKLEEDHDTAVLKLSNIGLSLSRWEKAVGLSGAPIEKDQMTVLEPKARPLLEGILKRFEKAGAKSEEFKLRAKSDDLALVNQDMDPKAKSLSIKMHAWMRTRYINQQNRMTRVRWAIYEKKVLNSLISDLRELVDSLINLFPTVHDSQRQLCEIEVSELGDDALVLMHDVAKDDDEIMEEVVTAEITERQTRGHVFKKFDIDGKTDLIIRVGDTVARGAIVTRPGSNYEDFKIRGLGHVNTGDHYG